METKLTENEKIKLEKVYECICNLKDNIVNLDTQIRDIGWPFDEISPENYKSDFKYCPAEIFEELPFTFIISLLYETISFVCKRYGEILEKSVIRDSDDQA